VCRDQYEAYGKSVAHDAAMKAIQEGNTEPCTESVVWLGAGFSPATKEDSEAHARMLGGRDADIKRIYGKEQPE
jgi:hypothetical protein